MAINIDATKLNKQDRIIAHCKVVNIPSGDPPKAVIIELPGADGARIAARWPGFPTIAVNDYVRVQRRGLDGQHDIIGTDAGTVMRGGYPFGVITVDVDDVDADYDNASDAITAASAGDVIVVGPGIYSEALAVNKTLTIIGHGEDTIFTSSTNPTIDITASGTILKDLKAITTSTDTSPAAIEAAEDCILIDIIARNESGGTNRRGVYVAASKTATLMDCDCKASGAAGSDYGLLVAGTAIVRRGKYEGDSNDIYIASGGTVALYDPILVNDSISISGDIVGTCFDNDGLMHVYDADNRKHDVPLATTGNETIYVATTGNDSTGDGSSGSPYATIEHAFNDIIPAKVQQGHTITIQLADGTYNLSAHNYLYQKDGGGTIVIQGNTGDRTAVVLDGGASYRPIYLSSMLAIVQIKYMTLEDSNADGIYCDSCSSYINIEQCVIDSNAGDGVNTYGSANVRVYNCDITGNGANGILVENGGFLSSNNNTSTVNNSSYGLYALRFGRIGKSGASQPGGASGAENTASGGAIA